ncbi:axial regulator YABBY 4 [Cannabis sativa]|uniref:axial regulator YABBY 4 n=1 Tax=Cannabis sativa TaxID=3483 RepID=UPI0029C9EDB4|nr:axial regulator YABBY 4 [Cannabis sativa]
MSTLNQLFNLSEQICYVQCGFCTTILLVSVPCSSLSMVVTVRCGHCTTLLSVNMMKASFVPLQLLASLSQTHHEQKEEVDLEEIEAQNAIDTCSPVVSSDNEEGDSVSVNQIVNKPPEKRQRAPSAYNSFIREEIKRLKAENPNMAHKEAFSAAAKNWAHFPPTQYIEDGESCNQKEEENNSTWDSHDVNNKVDEDGKVFFQKKGIKDISTYKYEKKNTTIVEGVDLI